MASDAQLDAHISGLLASLERNLNSLVKVRDPQTADLAYDLQKAIDKIRADLGHPVQRLQHAEGDISAETERAVTEPIMPMRVVSG